MGLFEDKYADALPVEELSDKELIRATKVGSIARRSAAVEEAARRGLKNPNTGKPFEV